MGTPDTPGTPLAEARARFILLWSQMGAEWGIPRTTAQVHALLFIVGEAMSADDVMAELGVSRGSASMTLRQLVEWNLVQRVHRRGERREFFEAEQDVWKLLQAIVALRKRREIDPLIQALEACRGDVDGSPGPGGRAAPSASIAAHNERIEALKQVVGLIDAIGGHVTAGDGETLRLAVQLLGRAS